MSADTNSANSTQPPAADRSANRTDPDRNLALELVRATEAAVIACSRYMGFGDKEQVDPGTRATGDVRTVDHRRHGPQHEDWRHMHVQSGKGGGCWVDVPRCRVLRRLLNHAGQ